MATIDNFEQIKKLLSFESEDDFYFCQIIQRKKDHPEGLPGKNNNSRAIKTYCIKSIESLDFYKDEMIQLAAFHNARVGINLNKRSFEKIAFQTLRKITDQILNKDYYHTKKAFDSCCGTYSNEPNKKWIIDIDDKDLDPTKLLKFIKDLQPAGDKFIDKINTKNGYHLIVKPFDMNKFHTNTVFKIENIDVHKDNPTILYIP